MTRYTNTDENYMRQAIAEAEKNLTSFEGGPFGACIVKDGVILAVARNTVLKHDATCHAEMNAIREASKKIGHYDLSGAIIYTTTEPCTMCFSAIHWARIDAIYFGTTIGDAKNVGFNELYISNEQMKTLGESSVAIHPHLLRDECMCLFERWNALDEKVLY